MSKSMLILGLLLVSGSAFASGTVCSGVSSHYVTQRVDIGIQPPDGFRLGEAFFSRNGNLLGRVEYFSHQPNVGSLNYEIHLEDQKTLTSGGNQVSGWRVFTATLRALPEITDPAPIIEFVTCREDWAFVP